MLHLIARTLTLAAVISAAAISAAEARFLQTDPVGYKENLNLYQYVLNDPLNASDPSGMTGIIYYDDAGNVHIEIQATFSGDAANAANIAQVTSGIESGWTGQFGQYNVTTIVTQVSQLGPSSNEIVMQTAPTSSPSGHAQVINNYRMEIPTADLATPPAALNGTVANSNVIPHEGGHLLGEPDLYKLPPSAQQPWMAGNIMNTGPNVHEQNITNAIQNANGVNDVTHCASGVAAGGGCNP